MSFLKRLTVQVGRAFRETGQALDRAGLRAIGDNSYRERFSRHRQIMNLFDQRPTVAVDAFVAPSASIIGNVIIADKASVWYGSVLRGDNGRIDIGAYTNIQDGTVISTGGDGAQGSGNAIIGNQVTVGHGCVLHACTIEDDVLIGMGAVVMDGAVVEKGAMIAAGAVVPPGRIVPAGQLWAGNPAKHVRDVTGSEKQGFVNQAQEYAKLASTHGEEFLPYGTAYMEAEKIKAQGGQM